MRTPILKTAPAVALILATVAFIGLSGTVAHAQVAEEEISVDNVTLERDPEVESYDYRRDYIYLPIREDPQLGDIPPIPDERNTIGIDEFGDRYIEDMPERVIDKTQMHRVRARKLARGISNFFLCWMEIPYQVTNSIEESDPGTGLLVGGITGLMFTATRAGVGAYEIVTFWNKRPGNYDTIMEPEFLIHETWGDGVPPFTVKSPSPDVIMTEW